MKNKKMSYVTVSKYILREVFSAAPGWIIIDCIAMLMSAICYALSTVVKQDLFDSITGVINGKLELVSLIIVTILVIIFQSVNQLLNAVCNFTWAPASRTVIGKLKMKIHAKIANLSANVYENVETLECIKKADMGVEHCYGLYNSIATVVVFYIPYFVTIGIYMWRLEPTLLLALCFLFVPLALNMYVRQKVFSKQIDETISIQRVTEYLETEIFSRETLKENRIYGSYSFFRKKYITSQEELCRKKWKAVKKAGLIEVGLRSLTFLGYICVIWMLLVYVRQGKISVGAFAAIFSSIATFISFMGDAMGNYLGNLFENMGALRNYVDFFSIEEESKVQKSVEWKKKIEAKHITFSYPGNDKKILDDISLTIYEGDIIALVGENGAGKSTLARILLGILDPDEGEVIVDGVNIKSMSSQSKFRYVSAVFQKFMRYKMSLRENVEISDRDEKNQDFKECLLQAGFKMNEHFRDGYETMLSRDFDGIELSGGQWQRIAVARGIYPESHFIVFDEPTAAIDPIEEGSLYRELKKIMNGKMGIIITHRLGSVKIANRIIVLDKGRIVEVGTHEELLGINGKYASIYNEQAKLYKDFEN